MFNSMFNSNINLHKTITRMVLKIGYNMTIKG